MFMREIFNRQENIKTLEHKNKLLNRIVFMFLCSCVLILPLSPAQAADYYFNPHFILTDEEMADSLALSLLEVENFLAAKNSALASQYFLDYQGRAKKASEIIWQASQESKINPKVLLTTLQKEQSLISDSDPSADQLAKAMGYRCPDGDVCNPKALGFGKQVDGAAWQFRQYLDNPFDWNFQAGGQYEIDGYFVSPANKASADLYNYTPHIAGNRSFFNIWQDFWGRDYPDGSLVKTVESPAVWHLKSGQRRLIYSWGVLLSRFDPRKILSISRTDLEKYGIGPAIKFYNYSLLNPPNGKIYLLADDQLRYISSPEVFRTLGFNWEEIIEATQADLAGYSFGPELTVQSIYPTGALLQNKQTGGVYFVENGVKQPIFSKEIMKVNFPGKILTSVSPEELDKYQTGEPVKFKDGELIKAAGDSKVYVIAGGFRRWIKTARAFANFSYKWDNIITTTPQAVAVHPLGEDLE